MKNKFIFLFILVLTISLQTSLLNEVAAQTTRTVNVGDFHSIYVNSDYNVTLRQSNTQEIKVKTDPEIWSNTTIWVDNGILHIDMKKDEGNKKSLLNKIEDKLTATMEINISAKDTKKVIVNGNGTFRAENSISVPVLDLEMNGSGRMILDARSTLVNASIFTEGTLEVTGFADQLNLNVYGGGSFAGENFDVKKINADVRGDETTCTVSVGESLDIKVYGGPEVFYTGNGKSINKRIYGDGFVLYKK